MKFNLMARVSLLPNCVFEVSANVWYVLNDGTCILWTLDYKGPFALCMWDKSEKLNLMFAKCICIFRSLHDVTMQNS